MILLQMLVHIAILWYQKAGHRGTDLAFHMGEMICHFKKEFLVLTLQAALGTSATRNLSSRVSKAGFLYENVQRGGEGVSLTCRT